MNAKVQMNIQESSNDNEINLDLYSAGVQKSMKSPLKKQQQTPSKLQQTPQSYSTPIMKMNELSLRVASGTEEVECFCLGDPVGRGTTDLRLGCNCLVHYDCLVSYIRVALGDKMSLMNSMVATMDDGDDTDGSIHDSRESAKSDASDQKAKRKGILVRLYTL